MSVLVDWLYGRYTDAKVKGSGAVVVGCGYGHDAEFVASLGFATTAFDISATAVRTARERHEPTSVDYQQADLLALPECWLHGFDLVVESTTLQCLPRDLTTKLLPEWRHCVLREARCWLSHASRRHLIPPGRRGY